MAELQDNGGELKPDLMRQDDIYIDLIVYNFNRPHESLGYLAPVE